MSDTLTLVFELDALQRLADPEAVLADADAWTAAVGIASEETPEGAAAFSRRVEARPDFVASVTGESDGLAVVKRQYPTARHVFVGATDANADRRSVKSLGWEYVALEDAAAKAGWELAAASGRWGADAEPDA